MWKPEVKFENKNYKVWKKIVCKTVMKQSIDHSLILNDAWRNFFKCFSISEFLKWMTALEFCILIQQIKWILMMYQTNISLKD